MRAGSELPPTDSDDRDREDEKDNRDQRLGDRPCDIRADDKDEHGAERQPGDCANELGDLGKATDAHAADCRGDEDDDDRGVEDVHPSRPVRLAPGSVYDDRLDPEIAVVEEAGVGNRARREFGAGSVTAVEEHAGVGNERAGGDGDFVCRQD